MGCNIYLIGMMGVGKTTIGKLLAQTLQYRFVDTDQLVEACTNQTIREIFATAGETEFRQLEHQVLGEVSAYTRLVVATGGGIVLQPENWGHLRNGIVVWLDVPVLALYERLKTDSSRPLLQTADPLTTLTAIYECRRSLYDQADIHLPIDTLSEPELVCQQLLHALGNQNNVSTGRLFGTHPNSP